MSDEKRSVGRPRSTGRRSEGSSRLSLDLSAEEREAFDAALAKENAVTYPDKPSTIHSWAIDALRRKVGLDDRQPMNVHYAHVGGGKPVCGVPKYIGDPEDLVTTTSRDTATCGDCRVALGIVLPLDDTDAS